MRHTNHENSWAGIIFDMDGTLTIPVLDFDAMRREIGLPADGGDLAVLIEQLPPAQAAAAWETIARHEARATEQARLQSGALELLAACRRHGLKLGLLTRNTQRSVKALCRRFGLRFDTVLTREFPHLKPSPEPVLHICREWGTAPARVMVVGDYVHDLESGRAAGAATVFVRNPGATDFSDHADWTVDRLEQLYEGLFPNPG